MLRLCRDASCFQRERVREKEMGGEKHSLQTQQHTTAHNSTQQQATANNSTGSNTGIAMYESQTQDARGEERLYVFGRYASRRDGRGGGDHRKTWNTKFPSCDFPGLFSFIFRHLWREIECIHKMLGWLKPAVVKKGVHNKKKRKTTAAEAELVEKTQKK